VKMDGVVTDRFSLQNYTDAFARMEGGTGSIKAILIP